MIKTTGNTSSSTSSKSRSALGGGDTYSNAAGDFDVAVVNGTRQLQITNAPHTLLARNIVAADKILNIVTGTNVVQYIDTSMVHVSESSGTYTVTLSGMSGTFSTGDDPIVNAIWPNKNRDNDLDSDKVILQNPPWEHYTGKEALISAAQTLTTSMADLGGEIDMRTYNQLGLWLTVDINAANNVEIRLLHKHTSAGSEEYREIYLGTPGSNITTINLNDYQVGADSDQLIKFNIPVSNTTGVVQIQARMETDGGTDGQIDAAYITKAYGA